MNVELAAAIEAGKDSEIERRVEALSPKERLGAVIHYCCHRDDEPEPIEAVRLLLDAGCPTDDGSTLHHLTPLHFAAWFGDAAIVDLLVDRGAPVDMRDFQHSGTPLDWALAACRREQRRAGGNYAHVINTLLEQGATWDAAGIPTGDPDVAAIFKPLLEARLDGVVASGDAERLERLLAGGPKQSDLDLGLCVAAQLGRAEVCKRLLDAGAVVRIPKMNGWTALHAGVRSGDVATIETLLEGGADVHITNVRGGTVWHALGEFGASPEMIDVVVRHGGQPDINRPSMYGYTSLDLAIGEKHAATIEHLRSLGAEPLKKTLPG